MNRREIEHEVRRLSPWYYRFDLGGVLTDTTPACDRHGHRSVSLTGGERFLAGRTVLDVACNEGGYSFAALDVGAERVATPDDFRRAVEANPGSVTLRLTQPVRKPDQTEQRELQIQ